MYKGQTKSQNPSLGDYLLFRGPFMNPHNETQSTLRNASPLLANIKAPSKFSRIDMKGLKPFLKVIHAFVGSKGCLPSHFINDLE